MSDIKKIKDDYIDKLNTENNIDKVNNIKSELFGKNGIISNEFKKLGSISVEERKKLVSEQVNSSAAFLLKCLLFHFKSSIFNIPRHTIN